MLGSPALFDRHVNFIFNVCVIIFLNCPTISSVDTVKKKKSGVGSANSFFLSVSDCLPCCRSLCQNSSSVKGGTPILLLCFVCRQPLLDLIQQAFLRQKP